MYEHWTLLEPQHLAYTASGQAGAASPACMSSACALQPTCLQCNVSLDGHTGHIHLLLLRAPLVCFYSDQNWDSWFAQLIMTRRQ